MTKDKDNLITKMQIDAKTMKEKIAKQLALDEALVIKHDDDNLDLRKEFIEDQYQEDKIDLGDQLLKPHKLFLTFSSNQKVSQEEFDDYGHEQKKRLRMSCHFFLFIIYLIQTVILIAARFNVEKDQLILVLRGVFLLILGLSLIFGRFLKQKISYITVSLYLYGIIVCCLQYYYSRARLYAPWFAEIELIELALLYLVVTSCW